MARSASPEPPALARRRAHHLGAHPIARSFFTHRCTHLAAMVAYYALLSLLPLIFLSLSLIAFAGRPDESNALIRELERVFPGQSVESIVQLARTLQRNARELSLIGAVGLLWGALGFLSALESALNIVYDVPNRRFVRQKLLAFGLVGVGLIAVLAALLAATAAHAFLQRHVPGLFDLTVWRLAATLAVSTLVTFAFLLVAYRLLPNTEITTREILPGTILATVLLQASFEILPLYLRYSATLPALRAFGGAVVLLVWMYLMGNVILLGAEVNWWVGKGRELAQERRLEEMEALGHS
jgi:membrane protein